MPYKLKDSEGKEHEVSTKEEIEALVEKGKQEAVEKTKKELEEKFNKDSSEKEKGLKEVQAELKIANEALGKAEEGTRDWANLRKNIQTLENQVTQITKEKDTLKEMFSGEIRNVRTSIFKGQVDSWMDNLAGGDAELKKKLEFQYNRLGSKVESEKEAQEVLKDAFVLATGKQAPNMFNVARGVMGTPPKSAEPITQEVAALAKNFGISDADVTKYSAKAQEKKSNQSR